MATSSHLLSRFLRRSRHVSAVYASHSITITAAGTVHSHPFVSSHHNSLAAPYFVLSQSFSTGSVNGDSELNLANSSTDIKYGVNDAVAEGAVTASFEDYSLPVETVISLLDHYHDLTGFPWWIIIASSTVAMRAALLPLLVLQLHKLQKISECFPKLPPPFPPPGSGKSYIHQFSLFRERKRALGCPSFLWFFTSFSVQVPCFFLWMASIRRMSLDQHPGFDSGGILWFQNLTEFPNGGLGIMFPVAIAGLHYINVQLSFKHSSVQNITGLLGLLARYYKHYLDFLTLPLFFTGFCIPQGSLVYWITNSSLSAIQTTCSQLLKELPFHIMQATVQQFSLQHPAVREKLGLPKVDSPTIAKEPDVMETPESASFHPTANPCLVSAEDLSPEELVSLSLNYLSDGLNEKAIHLLQLALKKDPDHMMALIVMGQTLMQKGWHAEACEILERAISKLLLHGHSGEANQLMVASQWAGVACIQQGKNAEGILHLERVAGLKEPKDPKSKSDYFEGLVLLASVLSTEGRKVEAVKHLRRAVAYNPNYQELLDQRENEVDNLVSDLVSSRRGDY